MIQLNYYVHLILNSKYRLLFTFLIYILIYFFVRSAHVSFCMNTDVSIPDISETRARPSHQVLAIRNEIANLAGQTEQIQQQTIAIETLTAENLKYREENIKLKRKIYEYIQNKEAVRKKIVEDTRHVYEQRFHVEREKSNLEKAGRYVRYLEHRVRNLAIDNALLNKQLNMQGLKGTPLEEMQKARDVRALWLSQRPSNSLYFDYLSDEEQISSEVKNKVNDELREHKPTAIFDKEKGKFRRHRKYY